MSRWGAGDPRALATCRSGARYAAVAGVVSALVGLGLALPAAAHRAPEEELAALDAALARSPSALLRLRRGRERVHLGRWEGALSDLEALDPEALPPAAGHELQLLMAAALSGLARWAEAEPLLVTALTTRDDAEGRRLRARLYAQTGRAAKSLCDWRRLAELGATPDDVLAWARLAERTSGPEAGAAALSLGHERLGAVVLRREQVALWRRHGRPERGLQVLDQMLAAEPRQVPWLMERAALLDELARAEEARQQREDALLIVEEQLLTRPTAARREWARTLRASLSP